MIIGDQIHNASQVFFDINLAIVTNITIDIIPEPQSIETVKPADGIYISPNPAAGMVNIDNLTGVSNSIKIVNTLGQVLQSSPLNSGLNTLNIEVMPTGLYYYCSKERKV